METLDAIKGRRSIRAFKDKEIPEPVLHNVLEAAQWAPSAGNLQSTRLIIVTDKKQKQMLAKLIYDQMFIAQAPVVLIVCANDDALVRHYGDAKADLFAVQNSAVACQNILLAAHDQGLGACWVAPIGISKIKRELKIPADTGVHAVIPIGYAAEWPSIPGRISIADLCFHKEWGNLASEEPLWPLEESAPRIAKKVLKKAAKKIKRK